MRLIKINTLIDNYIWLLVNNQGYCLIIDPGNSDTVINVLNENNWYPLAIFLTHHHFDHVDGVLELKKHFLDLKVYGPQEAESKGVTNIVSEGECIFIENWIFFVINTPGHTLGHVSFYGQNYLFCGDTIFSGGCGRVLEGTSKQMYQSIQKINSLPEETLICCAHEYTLSNMRFAINLIHNDSMINDYYHTVSLLTKQKLGTLPVTLKNERKVNIFLRTNDDNLFKKINKKATFLNPEKRFKWLRSKKDNFKY